MEIEIIDTIKYSTTNQQLLPRHGTFPSSFPSKFRMSSLGEDRNQVRVSHHPSFSVHWPRPFPYVGPGIFWVVLIVGLAVCFWEACRSRLYELSALVRQGFVSRIRGDAHMIRMSLHHVLVRRFLQTTRVQSVFPEQQLIAFPSADFHLFWICDNHVVSTVHYLDRVGKMVSYTFINAYRFGHR